MDTLSFPEAGPYNSPIVAAQAPSNQSAIKTLVLICLVALLGANIIAILAHTTMFASNAAAATVRELTAKVIDVLGLTTKGAVATATALDQQIEASLDAVSAGANAASSIAPPKPDSAESNMQCRGKQGWCYVGQQDGYRSCLEVGPNNYCQS